MTVDLYEFAGIASTRRVPVGHVPTVEEAVDRFDRINKSGPGPDAFTFRKLFTSTGKPI